MTEHTSHKQPDKQSDNGIFNASPKATFFMGLMTGLAIVSIVGFSITFSMLKDGKTLAKGATNTNSGTVAGVNTDPTPSPTPSPSPTVIPNADVEVTDSDHIKGGDNAKVVLVEYSDFECSFCARVQPTLQQIEETYGDDVQLVFRHYPLSFHSQAQKAAEASECASEQGKFWEMHDKLFEMNSAGTLGVASFKTAAGELGLTQSQFDNCLDSGKYAQAITNSLTEGTALGVQGTPATFVNGQLISGAVPYEQFASVIDAELAK